MIKDFFKLIKSAGDKHDYTNEYEIEVARYNLRCVRYSSIVVSAVIFLYYAITILFYPEMSISHYYALFIPVLLLFFTYSVFTGKHERINPKTVTSVTFLLYIIITLFVIVMSVFPHPDRPSIYYHLFIVVAPVVFVVPAQMQLCMSLLSLPLFYYLVINYKSPDCFSHELFEAATAAVFSIVLIFFMTQYRLQSESRKNKYYILSRTDALTGVYNKNAGEAEIKDYLDKKGENEIFSLMFIDIDAFKSINDNYGHLEGDRVLKMLGARLVSLSRKGDIICRFGGDEFVILVKNIRDRDTASTIARSIVDAIGEMDFQLNQAVTCSAGVYFGSARGMDTTKVFHFADSALYTAKHSGKNRYEIYDENQMP